MSSNQTTRKEMPIAVHMGSEAAHVVAIMALHVLIVPSGDGFYAQGLEIDYASSGATVEDAQRNFERGLELTVRANLDVHGSIDGMFKSNTPASYWQQYKEAKGRYELTNVWLHDKSEALRALPFDSIQLLPAFQQAA